MRLLSICFLFLSLNLMAETYTIELPEGVSVEKAIPTCLKWEIREVCMYRTVCEYVCTAAAGAIGARTGGSAIGGAATAVGGKVCENVCKQVPDCRKEHVCAEWAY